MDLGHGSRIFHSIVTSQANNPRNNGLCGFKKRLTTVKSNVTCKNCLKKIGIEQKPVVDEQKREMALFVSGGLRLEDTFRVVKEARVYLKTLEA